MADEITHTIGRRKEAVCRVYLKPGSGKWDVNGRTLGDYFPRPALVTAIQQPFTATDKLGQYDVSANLHGGGQTGQAGAPDAVGVSALPFERGDRNRIVISEYEFPTVGQIAHAQELRGAEVVHVRPEADGSIQLSARAWAARGTVA